jgi:hypothetical protein
MTANDDVPILARFPVRIAQTQVGMATLFGDGRFLIDPFYSDLLLQELLRLLQVNLVDGITVMPNYVPAQPASLPEVTKHDE